MVGSPVEISFRRSRAKMPTVANVADAEEQYQAHEFMDAATQPKSVWISPNEVYTTHALLSQHLENLVC